jgi:hypothetical protein
LLPETDKLIFMFSLHGRRMMFHIHTKYMGKVDLYGMCCGILMSERKRENSFQTSKNKHFQDFFFS